MFRKIRRTEREIGIDKACEILNNADYGVLSLIGDNGYPYGVPVNYAYVNGKLYFHSTSQESHKLDAIRQNNKVCFTVIAKHDVVLDELSTNYESVIVFGAAHIIDEPSEKTAAMGKMMSVLGRGTKYATEHGCGATAYVMVEITPEHISGKGRKNEFS